MISVAKIQIEGAAPHTEDIEILDGADPQERWEEIIERFNSTLKQGERPRKFIGLVSTDFSEPKKHTWEKQNLFTIVKGGLVYDIMKCRSCGITGKRYGLSEATKIDSKFRAKVYLQCDTAKTHLAKKKLTNSRAVR